MSPTKYLRMLRRFALVATPDFSMYIDYPKAVQIWNHYRKQWMGRYWQREGVQVVPTVSWSDEESFDWCFDGIPENMPVIISAIGTGIREAALARFRAGYEEMVRVLRPSVILVYGKLPDGCRADLCIETHAERVRKRVKK